MTARLQVREGLHPAPTVAIIPARGGSKRIPGKNVKPLLGVPLLQRTVRMLRHSQLFDHIIISTDDDRIMQVARDAGAEAPFRRPAPLADDFAPTAPVIAHAIEQIEETTGPVGNVCCVYPAAVFVTADDLRRGLARLEESDAEVVMSATTFDFPIQRALRRLADGSAEMIWPENRLARSQDLEEAYHDAGQFYWGRREHWITRPGAAKGKVHLLLMPRWRVQDIDTPEDWERAELLVEILQRRGQI